MVMVMVNGLDSAYLRAVHFNKPQVTAARARACVAGTSAS